MNTYVTKSFLPPFNEYGKLIEQIWNSSILTNQGPLLKELENKLKDFLNVNYFHYLTNGTIALQLALSALGINDGEIITTPFSYVATTSSILWQRCNPVFIDIEPNNFTIDAMKIESAITKKTRAILAVHVFGYACNVNKIEEIAKKYNLKVIYDGAHAFGSIYNGKSLLDFGDISTLSFHATKLFHTVEGGACIIKDENVSKILELQKKFGHEGNEYIELGINAKASEFHAAMGLANFPYIKEIIQKRKSVSDMYSSLLKGFVQFPKRQEGLEYNYAYFPVVFKSETELLNIVKILNQQNIYPRRYFYPSLNQISYLGKTNLCPMSEDISRRILCLPLFPDLEKNIIQNISEVIINA